MRLSSVSTGMTNKILSLFDKKVLIIYLNEVLGPFFTLWKWSHDDYKKEVELQVEGLKVIFYFEINSFEKDEKRLLPERQWPLNAHIFIVIENPTQELLDGLNKASDEKGLEAANKIYSIYNKVIDALTLHGRWYLKLSSIFRLRTLTPFNEMFYGEGFLSHNRVLWRIGNNDFKPFLLKKKREKKINPRFLSKNLLSVDKWAKFKKYLASASELSPNIAELVRIKSKVDWNEKRIPAIEIAAIMEVVIRNAVTINLKKQGVSNRKIESSNDEAGLSILLNMLLPLILVKKEIEKYKTHLDNLDVLRKLRNRIMHDNLSENEINLEVVENGIDSAIEITLLLERNGVNRAIL